MSIPADQREKLVSLARSAAAATVTGDPLPRAERVEGVLVEHRGCFVTLTNHGKLRGCIGTFQPTEALAETIIEMGAAAARDPRFIFDPVTPAELPKLTVQVSVLSPLEETDEPEKLRVGTHGIYIVRGAQAGCFLPEVAVDMGWDAEEFLDRCCMGKANLPKGAWRQPQTKVYLFTSEKFEQ